MRGRISDVPSYAPPVALWRRNGGRDREQGQASKNPNHAPGDWLLTQNGWQEYAVSDGKGVFKLGSQLEHPSYALGVLGMPGFTAYMGLLDIKSL